MLDPEAEEEEAEASQEYRTFVIVNKICLCY